MFGYCFLALVSFRIMELREIIKIFMDRTKLFLGVVLLFALGGLAVFFLQPERYSANLMLNVTRKGVQNTDDYRYDDFYRLQADERFADTVVRWIGTPQISEEIYTEAGVVPQGKIEARRLSSQMIEAVFILNDKGDARKISDSALKVLNRQTEKLDEFQKGETWFTLISSEPFVSEKKIGFVVAFSASVLLGLFFGAWGVMIAYYLKK
ncbi:MAG: hypothetical protein UW87_C0001G0004 [Candidatus Moranbacteria bacterium GW2011_GWC2_45_10]|nr:MAG: hypothetical protein UW87_C0001G0004 [Candidatus Moranbacteria bacterium GW2011_GWC2_45_10]